MANSLHDQLLKAGLVDEKKVHKAKKAKQRKAKEQRHGKQKTEDESKRLAREAKTREAARNRELNRKKQAEVERRAIAAQVRQLIETNRLSSEEGDIAYHFNDTGKIRQIHVTESQHGQLIRGQLAVVKLDGRYALVADEIAEKVRSRDAASVIPLNTTSDEVDEDDPYAAYKVPDDLMW